MDKGAMVQIQVPEYGKLRSHGSGFRVKDQRKGLWNLPPKLRKAAEATCVAVLSMHGDLGKPLCEAVKVKTRLPWRPLNDVSARAMK